jgi:hypothetical protein
MAKDRINIRILEDGRIVCTTGKIGFKNHIEAEDALAELTALMGGEEIRESTKKQDKHFHRHTTDHAGHSH